MSELSYKTFVIGSPINHSLSPIIHNYWLSRYQKEGSYEAVKIEHHELEDFFIKLKKNFYRGGNITIPHKETSLKYIDNIDPIAKKIGAVNCVWLENDKICATNTDAYGFITYLDTTYKDCCYQNILLLGAGGSARAVLYALSQKNIGKIYLANRTLKRAQELARSFDKEIIPISFLEINEKLNLFDLIINTASFELGKQNFLFEVEFPFFDFKKIKKDAIIYDIVYKSSITSFLKEAKKNDLRTLNGLGMLIYQAIPSFQRWYGIKPDVNNTLQELLKNKI